MKSFCVDLILVGTLILLITMSFSIVQAADPAEVRNEATMEPPYEAGNSDWDYSPKRDASAGSEYNNVAGSIYAFSYTQSTSSAWAEANLTDAFKIIHSSRYDITFNFNYSGFIEIDGIFPFYEDRASVKVIFKVALVDRDSGIIVKANSETIQFNDEVIRHEYNDSKTLAFTGLQLEADHIYDWTVGIRTEAETIRYFLNPIAIADFGDSDQGYEVKVTKVLIEDIYSDYVAPTTTSSISGTIGENDWYTSSVSMTLTATDNSPPNGYGVEYTNRRINGGPWSIYGTPLVLSSDGTSTVEYYSVDKADNYEDVQNVNVKIDQNPPTGQIRINDNQQYTSSREVLLSTSTQDGQGSGVSEMRFRNQEENYDNWIPYTTSLTPWILPTGDGTKRVFAQFKDNAGHVSNEYVDEIILDTEPPSATMLINEGDEYSNSTSVILYMTYSDSQGVLAVRYSNDGQWDTEPWENPSETKQWLLLPEDGYKTVYAQYKDWTGLNSATIYDTIILDTYPPTGAIEINNGASSTTSISVTVTPNATDANGVSQMRLRNDGAEWSNWEEVTVKQWNLTSGLGSKTVFAQFQDNAGWISPSYNATIDLVEPQPTPSPTPAPTHTPSPTPVARGNIIVYVIDENKNPINGATVISTAQPTGQSPLNAITDSQGAVTFNNIITGAYSFHASKGIFGSDNVETNVRSQETSSVNITLREDLIVPSISVTLIENLGIAKRGFTVTVEDDVQGSGIANITLYVDEVLVATWTTAGTHNYNEGVYSIGTHTYYVEAADNAGNKVRNPASGYFEFTVVETPYTGQTELWKLLGIVLVLANGSALLFFSLKRKKGKP